MVVLDKDQLSQKLDDYTQMNAVILNIQQVAQKNKGIWDAIKMSYQDHLKNAKDHNDIEKMIIDLRNLAEIALFEKEYLLAKKYYQQATYLNENINNPLFSIEIDHEMGVLNLIQGDFKNTIQFFEKAIPLYPNNYQYEPLFYKHGALIDLENLYVLEKDEQALGNIWKQLNEIRQKIFEFDDIFLNDTISSIPQNLKQLLYPVSIILGPDSIEYIEFLGELGSLYQFQKKYTIAKSLYYEAIKISERSDQKYHRILILIYYQLADLYLKQGRYESSREYFYLALDVMDHHVILVKDRIRIMNQLIHMAEHQKDNDLAMTLIEQTIEICEKNYKPDLKNTYQKWLLQFQEPIES